MAVLQLGGGRIHGLRSSCSSSSSSCGGGHAASCACATGGAYHSSSPHGSHGFRQQQHQRSGAFYASCDASERGNESRVVAVCRGRGRGGPVVSRHLTRRTPTTRNKYQARPVSVALAFGSSRGALTTTTTETGTETGTGTEAGNALTLGSAAARRWNGRRNQRGLKSSPAQRVYAAPNNDAPSAAPTTPATSAAAAPSTPSSSSSAPSSSTTSTALDALPTSSSALVTDDSNDDPNDTMVFGISRREVSEIATLALPAFGTLLADPLMSIIDTACIGHVSSLGLAALGPNTAIFNCVFQLFTFLPIATTATIARHAADSNETSAQEALTSAMYFAIISGVSASLLVYTFAPQLLAFMGSSPELVDAGLGYLRVRAIAIPVVLMCTVAQGACLGRQDARTPLFIFLVAGLTNIVADIIAVLPSGLNLGLIGAAYATLLAQTLALLLFGVLLLRRGHLQCRFIMPSFDEHIKPFANSSSMLLLGSVCRMGVYTLIMMSATMLSTTYVATHQVAMQVFWFLTYFVEPLFVAATSFVSRDLACGKVEKARRLVRTLVVLSALEGIVLAAISGASRFYAPFFTVDPMVAANLISIAGLMAVAQGVASVTLVVEGALIGMGELLYLAKVHVLNFAIICAYLYWGKSAGTGLVGIWIGIVLHQTLRLGQHASYLTRAGRWSRFEK